MSELRADTITGSDGTSPVTLTKQVAVKCWICLQNTGSADVVVKDSFNVSSTTDTNSNDTQIDMTNAMSDANFCELGTHAGGPSQQDRFISFVDDNKTASRMFQTANDVGTGDVGIEEANCCAIGDLA
jgi:hypothetical protein